MTGRARPGSRPGPLGQGVGLSCAAANDTWKRAHQMLTLDRPVRSTSAGTGWARSPPRRGRPPGHARPRPASTARRRAQRRRPRPRRRRRPPRRGGGAAWNGGASQCSYRRSYRPSGTESSWRYTCRPILPDHVTPGRSCGSVLPSGIGSSGSVEWTAHTCRSPASTISSRTRPPTRRPTGSISCSCAAGCGCTSSRGFEGRCPHRGALLADGRVEGANLICGVHGWDYRLDTGVSAYNPAERIYKFACHVQDGEVLVDKADLVEYRNRHELRRDLGRGKTALARGAEGAGTAICSGEGGMLPEEQAECSRSPAGAAGGRAADPLSRRDHRADGRAGQGVRARLALALHAEGPDQLET